MKQPAIAAPGDRKPASHGRVPDWDVGVRLLHWILAALLAVEGELAGVDGHRLQACRPAPGRPLTECPLAQSLARELSISRSITTLWLITLANGFVSTKPSVRSFALTVPQTIHA